MSSIILYTILNLTTYTGGTTAAPWKSPRNFTRYQLPLVANTTATATTTSLYFLNVTNSSEMEHVKSYWALSLLSIPAVTLFGNMLVITSVWRYHHLQTPINYFILGLAVADLLVAIIVMPFAVYVEINNGLWEFGPLVCDLFMATDVTCSTASIFLLTIISFDRYVAATQPIKYANSSKGVCQVTLINFVAWFVALCIASPMVLGLNNVQQRDETTCRFYNADFIIYSSTGSFCIPLILIIYLYARIWKVVKQRSRLARQRQAKAPTLYTYQYHNETEDPLLVEGKAPDSPTLPTENGTLKQKKLRDSNQHPYPNKIKKLVRMGQFKASKAPKCNSDTGRHLSLQDLRKLTLDEIVNRKNNSLQTSNGNNYSYLPNSVGIVNHNYRDVNTYESSLKPLPVAGLTSTFFSFDSKFEFSNADEPPPATENNQTQIRDKSAELLKQTPLETTPHAKMDKTTSLPPGADKTGFFNNSFRPRSPHLFRQTKKRSDSARSIYSDLSGSNIDSSCESNMNEEDGMITVPDSNSNGSYVRNSIPTMTVHRKSGVLNEMNVDDKQRRMSLKTAVEKRRASRKFSKFARKEKKATKTLAIVLGVFLICWVPFFTLNFLNAVCMKFSWESCEVGMLPFTLTTWLGYMNSFMNPIIYTIFNMDFRRAFKQLLCPCLTRKRIRRV